MKGKTRVIYILSGVAKGFGEFLVAGGLVIVIVTGNFLLFSENPPASTSKWLYIGLSSLALGGLLLSMLVLTRYAQALGSKSNPPSQD